MVVVLVVAVVIRTVITDIKGLGRPPQCTHFPGIGLGLAQPLSKLVALLAV